MPPTTRGSSSRVSTNQPPPTIIKGTPSKTSKTKTKPRLVAETSRVKKPGRGSNKSPEAATRDSRKVDDVDIAIANLNKAREDNKKLNIKDIQELKKDLFNTIKRTKRDNQVLEEKRVTSLPARTSRSGLKRGTINRAVYSDGDIVNKGIDHSKDRHFDDEEKEYLKKEISNKVKNVSDLNYDQLRYLIQYVFSDELEKVKNGQLSSEFHNRYHALAGKSKEDLFSEVRTSLFTNEQRDYVNGFLQGMFDTVSKDDNGDIKHSEINYVEIVMMAEVAVRIVKYVYKIESDAEALSFMRKSSYEAHGIEDDEED